MTTAAQPRDMQAAERALLSLQSKTTEALTQSVLSRHLVTQQMQRYLRRLHLEAAVSQLPVVHVAGTKGKGSTCAFCESILRRCGLRTALFTSPHLVSVTERFRLQGQPISDELYLEHFWAVWDGLHNTQAESGDDPPVPSFFRFLTLVAFHLFCSQQLDVVILEVGMGGRLDSTNVVSSPLVCGIASIGFDHMEVLGDTLPLIAREKGGIIKPAVPALTIPQLPEVIATLTDCAREEGSELTIVPLIPPSTPLGLDGDHQLENASLAVALCRRVLQRRSRAEGVKGIAGVESDDAALPAEFLSGLQATRWAGRCQLYADNECSNLSFFIDGAHTDASMAIACRWFQQQVLKQQQTAVDTSNNSSADTSADDEEEGELSLVSSSPPLSSSPPAYNVLLFNAGHVRNPFDLLQPVVSLGLSEPLCQFGSFLSCPFDHDRPHLSRLPAFETVLAQQPQPLQRFAVQLPPASSAPQPQQQTWQHTLFRAFDLLLAYQQKGREERGEATPAGGVVPPGSVSAPVYPHRNAYLPSSSQAVLSVRRLALRHPKVQFRVLVCGSLYLVGNVLEKLGHRVV